MRKGKNKGEVSRKHGISAPQVRDEAVFHHIGSCSIVLAPNCHQNAACDIRRLGILQEARMTDPSAESWPLLLSLLPSDWESQSLHCGAITRLRGFPSASVLLRVLLLHVGKGYSLRETAVQARLAGLAEISDVTVLNRLRQAETWWRQLCLSLLEESGVSLPDGPHGRRVRILDGTLVKEPGRTGSQWRIHYSLRLPSLLCDHFALTSTKGKGTAEILHRFPGQPGDLVLADRAYSTPVGIGVLHEQGADVLARWHSTSLPLFNEVGQPFDLLPKLRLLIAPGPVGEWAVTIATPAGRIAGRVCALRKSECSTSRAVRKIKRKARKNNSATKAATLEYAAYVIVFTTLPAAQFPATEVMEWYRGRWQIELNFKRWKTLASMGQLPKHDEESSRAWLYGKLLLALLAQKIIRSGRAISPWGYLIA